MRIPRAGGAAETLVDAIVKPMDLLVDATSVLWTERHDDDLQIWAADRIDGANRRMLGAGLDLTWAQDESHIYYMTEENGAHGDPVELFRVEKATGVIERLTNADFPLAGSLAVGGDAVYVFGELGFYAAPVSGGQRERIADGPVADRAVTIYGERLFYDNITERFVVGRWQRAKARAQLTAD